MLDNSQRQLGASLYNCNCFEVMTPPSDPLLRSGHGPHTAPSWPWPGLVFCVVICNLSAGMWKFVIVLMFAA